MISCRRSRNERKPGKARKTKHKARSEVRRRWLVEVSRLRACNDKPDDEERSQG